MFDEVHKTKTGLSHNNRPLLFYYVLALLILLFLLNLLKLHLIGYVVISFENALYLMGYWLKRELKCLKTLYFLPFRQVKNFLFLVFAWKAFLLSIFKSKTRSAKNLKFLAFFGRFWTYKIKKNV